MPLIPPPRPRPSPPGGPNLATPARDSVLGILNGWAPHYQPHSICSAKNQKKKEARSAKEAKPLLTAHSWPVPSLSGSHRQCTQRA